ncbi:hypothetical protein EVAR_80447_1 [Eumeta japonica]|uniref:Uncharacterized protein n=1 Tax=Eumeta variegata TaxID=151549 RepID=A0A4C1VIE1_EUMVA|nr:hypothetical protein EVAR_80447_1 [Eumeta japonica]
MFAKTVLRRRRLCASASPINSLRPWRRIVEHVDVATKIGHDRLFIYRPAEGAARAGSVIHHPAPARGPVRRRYKRAARSLNDSVRQDITNFIKQNNFFPSLERLWPGTSAHSPFAENVKAADKGEGARVAQRVVGANTLRARRPRRGRESSEVDRNWIYSYCITLNLLHLLLAIVNCHVLNSLNFTERFDGSAIPFYRFAIKSTRRSPRVTSGHCPRQLRYLNTASLSNH